MEHATKNNLCQRKNVFNPKDNTKKDPDIQKNGNEKLRLIKKANQSKLSRSKFNELRKKSKWDKGYAERKTEKGTNRKRKIKSIQTPQLFGKTFRKSFTSLPHFLWKQKAVVGGLAKAVGLKCEGEMERKLENSETSKKH